MLPTRESINHKPDEKPTNIKKWFEDVAAAKKMCSLNKPYWKSQIDHPFDDFRPLS